MSTNVFCAFCGGEVGADDSFVVDTPKIVQAFHYGCGITVSEALAQARRARGRCIEENTPDPLAERVKRLEAVWKLWLVEAEKGSISRGTFHAMKTLLGIEG